jgi:putative glutathione S-transferase
MGLLVEGVWRDQWYETKQTGGAFVRHDSAYHGRITADGSSDFPAEAGRYHLYVSLACPWAHRTLIYRKLKRLEDLIPVTVVDPLMLDHGWTFGETTDPINGASYLHQIYTAANPTYTGRVTVPVLWDKKLRTIVNNESAEIIRMFNHAFDRLTGSTLDLYPPDLAPEIDALNARIYETVNNGVYKAGFATSQVPYAAAVTALFETLDMLDARLGTRRYLVGDRITEADWRLFTTLVRFDVVYYGHFKCNLRHVWDYPNLWGYARDLYQVPGIAETVDLDQIKRHYHMSQRAVNPSQIVPLGPPIDFSTPHGRG